MIFIFIINKKEYNMSERAFEDWCKNIHSGGLAKCVFCGENVAISGTNSRLLHYLKCDTAKLFFTDIFSKDSK